MLQVTKKNLKLQVERAKKCTLLYVAAGSCSMLRFGNSKFSVGKNAENLAAAIEQMIKALPGRHKNVQARYVAAARARSHPGRTPALTPSARRHSASRPTTPSPYPFLQACLIATRWQRLQD
jgi:hypothetical protein